MTMSGYRFYVITVSKTEERSVYHVIARDEKEAREKYEAGEARLVEEHGQNVRHYNARVERVTREEPRL